MLDVVNPLQSMSYTNKDFVSIYTELLDLTKELASTWDPTISNESDPGVILLKLNAIIGDKLSYNSDTNVLELFPLSVTQERNARQLFEQLGYYMHWYKAATTDISIAWTGVTDSTTEYTIPAFTMVSDYNNNVVYTLIGPVDGTTVNTFKVGSQKLKLDGSSISFKAIQGVPVLYTINGESTITVNNLDENNRLYFPTIDIAENGIFITNIGANNYTDWVKVDNLLVQTVSVNNLYYRFGLTQDTSTCYIEFPENAEEIIKNGINVTYIKTLGQSGNVAYKTIEKFYNEITPEEDATIVLNTNNIRMLNYSSAINGKDPQSINSAYKGYKSTVGVFETLVTLRDYIGYILNSDLVSNGFVCDRTNDVQCTYNVMTESNDIDQLVTMIEKDNGNPNLSAFDLKLYLLQLPTSAMETAAIYSSTFEPLNDASLNNVKSYIEDVKCISHDYSPILPLIENPGRSHFCYFKNKYPISCRIVTQYQLTTSATNEVVGNIRKALYNALNSREMTFGEEVPTELVYNTIMNSDERIKTVMLDNIVYTTYAECYNSTLNKFYEVEISSADESPIIISTNPDAEFTVEVDEQTFVEEVGYGNYSPYHFVYTNSKWYLDNGTNPMQEIDLTDYGITISGSLNNDDYIKVWISIKTQLRDELYTKSVLAGVTQFFVEDEKFDYKLDQTYNKDVCNILKKIEKVSTNVDITISNSINNGIYNLRDNESIQLYSPNLIDSTTYSTYVKFEYAINKPLNAEEDYQLSENEYFIMYWKESQVDNLYKYAMYGPGNIIKLKSFDLESNDGSGNIGNAFLPYLENIGTTTVPVMFTSSDMNNRMSKPMSDEIAEGGGSIKTLSSTKIIIIRKINQVILESGDSYCYWVLNEKVVDSNGQEKYRLFDVGEDSIILNSGEYFIYTNSTLTNLTILGSGTLITRSDSTYVWEVGVKDSSDIVENGIGAFNEGDWFKIVPSNAIVTLTEQHYFNINEGSQFKLYLARNRENYCTVTTTSSSGLTVVIDEETWFDKTTGYGEYEFIYKTSDSTWVYVESGSTQTPVSLIDYGIVVTGTPSNNNYIKVNVSNWSITITSDGIYNGSTSINNLKDFDISYKSADSDTFTNVAALNLNSDNYSWMARTLLALNASNKEEQILLDNQSIICKLHNLYYSQETYSGSDATNCYFTIDSVNYVFTIGSSDTITSTIFDLDEEILYLNGVKHSYTTPGSGTYQVQLTDMYTLSGSDLSNNKYEKVFMTNYPISIDGGQVVSTYALDNNFEVEYLSLYVYEKYISNSTQIHINDDGEIDLEFLAGSSYSISLPFNLPNGEYILPIYVGSDELETSDLSFNITLDGNTLHAMNDATLTNFNKKQKYYVYVNLTGDSTKTLVFTVSSTISKNIPVILYNLYKYNYSESLLKFGNAEFQAIKILNLLQMWDTDNLFNYTYKVDSDIEISDPLEGKSFFLSNHIYNKFTIPQMMGDMDINIVGKK